ncbi:MAG: hypothetical protein KJ070_13930 [Verrucomicrobia bacterium]|nr:hypothetical protein [Verrucomicrobiota bacterium]
MKKLLMVGAIIVGAATVSQAGVSVSVSFGVPFPQPVVIRHPVPVYAPPVYAPPVVVAPAVCPPARVVVPCAPPPPPRYRHGYSHKYYGHGKSPSKHPSHYRVGYGYRR